MAAGTGGGVSSSSVAAAATSVGGGAQKKKKHKTNDDDDDDDEEEVFLQHRREKKNKTNDDEEALLESTISARTFSAGLNKRRWSIKGKTRRMDFGCGRKRRKRIRIQKTPRRNAETRNEEKKDDTKSTIYVVDANVCLHQMDVLSHPKSMRNVVVCTTVLEEVRNRSRNAYERLRRLCLASSSRRLQMQQRRERTFFVFSNEFHKETYVGEAKKGESANDRNDRAIREVVKFYEKVVGLCSLNDNNNDDDVRKARKKRSCTKGYLNF